MANTSDPSEEILGFVDDPCDSDAEGMSSSEEDDLDREFEASSRQMFLYFANMLLILAKVT